MPNYGMTNDDLLPLIAAVQQTRLAAPSKKPWSPTSDQWADASDWVGIPEGGPPRTWMHLQDFAAWRTARLDLAEAWAGFSGPPTKPVLTGLLLAGELKLLQQASRRWPLRCSISWCQKAFEQLLSAHYDQNAALPMPLALGLADWLVDQSRSNRAPVEAGGHSAWSRLFKSSMGGQEPNREEVLIAWWKRAHALGENANSAYPGERTKETVLFLAVKKEMWDLAEQLLKDGADPNAFVAQKGNALLTAIQKERQGQLTAPHRLLALAYSMLDHGLDWHQANPFPGKATFSALLAPNSVLHRVDEHWHALRKSEALEERLPEIPPPSPGRAKPRF